MEKIVVTGTPASFRFSTAILRRLGEELNPTLDQSILELVKNSFDADATTCSVALKNTDAPGGNIEIEDNGDGMDDGGILNGWLVLGSSTRRPDQQTRLNRFPAGSKGLGRLAALRLGSAASLTSRPRSGSDEYHLRIEWSAFDSARVVEEVPLIVEQRQRSKRSKGTDIVIENLQFGISRTDVKKLARSLILLADPFIEDPEGFKPTLLAPEFSDLETMVSARYFNDAEYHLQATLTDGSAKAVVSDWKGKTLYKASHDEISAKKDHPKYGSPNATFDLWAFILNSDTFATRTSSIEEVRNWLKQFGGVHLYQNGLRVSPYGNPGNDWLEMNLRRSRSPEERPSTNTAIGKVSIDHTDVLLVQKTDRSGFIETEVFTELKRFASDALDWMGRRRTQEAERRRSAERREAPKLSETARSEVRESFRSIPSRSRPSVEKAFQKYEVIREKEVKILRKEVQLYRTLSTAGITAATFAHESAGNPIKVIDQASKAIQRRARKELGEKYDSTIAVAVNLIIRSIDSLKVLTNTTLSLIDHQKRRATRVDIHQVLTTVLKIYAPFTNEREVIVTPRFAEANPYLRASEAAIESIITNFLNNSLTWFQNVHGRQRQIVISTELFNGSLRMKFEDNGPGIEGIAVDDVWSPGETTRENGTGLGLTIVRDAVQDLGGSVQAVAHSSLGGAEFVVEIPILGA
jgi:signal transduction histidine kinase